MSNDVHTTYLEGEEFNNAYVGLFGTNSEKGSPLFYVAEKMFHHFMSLMVSGYDGGVYDYLKVSTDAVDIEPTGFLPLIIPNSNEPVEVKNFFNNSAYLSPAAASFVVWIFLLSYLAEDISDSETVQRLYKTIQDLHFCSEAITDKNGNLLFSEEDKKGIYSLTN